MCEVYALLTNSGPDLEVPCEELATPRGLLRAKTLLCLNRHGLDFASGFRNTQKAA
jgi:hypothetical protein